MAGSMTDGVIERRDFSKIATQVEIPNLIDIQRRSYDRFLQRDVPPQERDDIGLQAAFTSVFPIVDYNETAMIEFLDYAVGAPKYDVRECLERGMTFAAPLKIRARLIVWEKDEKSGAKRVRDVREQEVYVGELPLMTGNGTFVINGTERVVVSQLQRSPGVIFNHDKGKTHASGKVLYSARVIPYRGSWLDFEFDAKDILYVRIDRRRKIPATVLLKAFGYTIEDLFKTYYPIEEITVSDGRFARKLDADIHHGIKASIDLVDKKAKETLVKEGAKLTRATLKKLKTVGIKDMPISKAELVGRAVFNDIVDPGTGEVLMERNQELTEAILEKIAAAAIGDFQLLYIDNIQVLPVIRDTLAMEKVGSPEEGMVEIYRRLRPGETPTVDTARTLFDNLFFNNKRYDLSPVGRLKLNKKLGLDVPLDKRTLTAQDIVETVRYLIGLKTGKGEIDDIDHLGNRRVRSVGELLENQLRIGLVRRSEERRVGKECRL